jgi:integron integrase
MERVRATMAARRLKPRTITAYAHWIRRYIRYHDRRHPIDLGEEHVRAFLNHLVVEDGVAAATQNQALAALLFLYMHVVGRPLARVQGLATARRSRHVPVVLTAGEVRRLLERLGAPIRLCATLMYGSGLRLMECASLRMKDVDLERLEVVVREGKGGKDRRTPLAQSCVSPLRSQMRNVERLYYLDLRGGIDGAGMPAGLARKYPTANRELRWRYLFPASRTYVAPDGGVRRDHVHATVIQRSRSEGSDRCRHPETRDVPFVASFLRNASSRVGLGHPHRPGAAWAQRRADDDDLHARLESGRTWGAQSG